MEFSLLGAAALAIVGIYSTLWWEAGRGNAADCTRDLWDMILAAGVAGLVAGRLAAMIGGGTNPLANLADILIIRSGVDTGIAALVAIGVAAFMARRDLLPTLDAIAPATVAGLAGWHAECLVTGACLGTPTGLPWGIAQTGSDIARHPVEIYAALLLVVGAVALIAWKRHHPPPGMTAGAALAWAGAARLFTEPMRPGIGTGPEWWYAAAIAAGVALAVWGLMRTRDPADSDQP